MDRNFINADNIINQDTLRKVEALCTTEEPPACMAACPLHVDARELCRLVAGGDWAGAFRVYKKTAPFALILSRICNAPCKAACRRAELGGAIEMQRLEQAVCAAAGKPAAPPVMLPKKKQSAAIIGGGLRGLSAANDLARKGYQVTIFEKSDALGGSILNLPPEILPREIIRAEIDALLKLKVKVEYGCEVPLQDEKAAAALLDEYDGVFVACASPIFDAADPSSQQVRGYERLLAGKKHNELKFGDGPVYDIYDGRSAASTLDRLFQGVNIQAGREKEGGRETSLFTNLQGIPSQAAAAPPGGAAYREEGAKEEAARCIQCTCMECVKKCGFLQHYKGNPRQYVREVYNNLSIAMGTHHANAMINTCALCSQCEAICPNGLDMAEVFRAARERMTKSGKMPQSAFEFGLLDLEYSMSDACFLARHQSGHTSPRALFFPGCQLAASEPALVRAVYEDLSARLGGGVGLMLACCGIPARWAGDEERFQAVKEQLRVGWEALDSPLIIAGCPTCAHTLKTHFGMDAENIFETLNRIGIKDDKAGPKRSMCLHHACGARHDDAVKESVLQLAAMRNVENTGEDTLYEQSPCCGYGGLVPVVDMELADAVTNAGLKQLGGEDTPVLTYCVNCRDRYLLKGREAWHLLELLYPDVERVRHEPPTWSIRQDNRAELKRSMLEEIWGETMEEKHTVKLHIDEALERKLNETHILHSDIAEVISHAEESGTKLVDPLTGHFTAYHRPRNVTFWVEYEKRGAGFAVYNAYSHRMDFILTDKMAESGAGKNG